MDSVLFHYTSTKARYVYRVQSTLLSETPIANARSDL